jgi:Pectate lyase superfamily protein
VYFPPGTYRVRSILTLPDHSTLIGHGPLSIIKFDPAVPAGAVLNSANNAADPGVTDIRIDNLTIDANSKSSSYVIKLVGGPTQPNKRVFVRQVEVKNHTLAGAAYAIYLARTQVGGVEDCHVHDTIKDGINLGGNVLTPMSTDMR